MLDGVSLPPLSVGLKLGEAVRFPGEQTERQALGRVALHEDHERSSHGHPPAHRATSDLPPVGRSLLRRVQTLTGAPLAMPDRLGVAAGPGENLRGAPKAECARRALRRLA